MLYLSASQALDLSDEAINKLTAKFGISAGQRLREWRATMQSSAESDELHKLDRVNRFFNRVPYVNDIEQWGEEDYWATPTEFLTSNGGDCEDYAIAKYLTLRKMGIPASKMRIAYVKALGANRNAIRDMVIGKSPTKATVRLSADQAHLVLTYYASPGAEPLILDNLDKNIRPASQRKDLTPVYSVDGDMLWQAWEVAGQAVPTAGVERQKAWQDLILRLRQGL